ncbi:MAG: GNAT family N-acetyltransferase [Pirellulales bacterium]|nr:GNAT family N-acetyltransferase [Pirellulales bacterium]
MPPSLPTTAPLPLEPRAWDSRHFGWQVGRITAAELSDAELANLLTAMRAGGFALVYWPTRADRVPAEKILAEFAGQLVDCKTTFSMTLPRVAAIASTSPTPEQQLTPGANFNQTIWAAGGLYYVKSYPQLFPCEDLYQLAVAAGQCSRFAVDANIPVDKFQELYKIWIERSVKGELANAVLAAYRADSAQPRGIVTISVKEAVGQIDLIAVAESERGRGLGQLLLTAAEQWMLGQSCHTASVVTQRHNLPACRLYEKHGFSLAKRENYYHFWPLQKMRSATISTARQRPTTTPLVSDLNLSGWSGQRVA